MSPLESAIIAAEVLLAVAAIVGIGFRGHWRKCYGFPVYLLCFALSEAAILAFPDRFYVLSFWLVKESVQGAIKLGIACEIGFRLFEGLPAARRRLGSVYLSILVATGLAVAPVVGDSVPDVVSTAMPRLLYGTAAAFVAVVVSALWYHVPMQGLQKAVVAGFSAYLVAFSAVLHILEAWGWDLRGAANSLNSAAFVAVLMFWAVAAWRALRAPTVPPELASWLPLWSAQRRA